MFNEQITAAIDVKFRDATKSSVENAGSVHPIAFSVSDDAAQVRVWQALIEKGFRVTGIKGKYYFKAIYFRTADGILFEVVTKMPRFNTYEPLEKTR